MSRNRPLAAPRAKPPAPRPAAAIPPAFVDDLIADWREHGREAIQRMRKWAPQRYVQLVAALAPAAASGQELIAAMSDAEIEQELRKTLTSLDRDGGLPAWLRLVPLADPADI